MQKKVPIRQCMGCRERRPKRELIRVVKTPEGGIVVDFRGKISGRGAYICHSSECLKKAVSSRAIERALEIKLPEEVVSQLYEQMERENGDG